MKKVFVEPKLKRIELNMSENIASSQVGGMMGYYFNVDLFCTIQGTDYTIGHVYSGVVPSNALDGCKVNANAKIGGGTIVADEEIVPYLR